MFSEMDGSQINEITFESLSPKAQQALVSLYKQNPISIWDVEEKINDKTKTSTLEIEIESLTINKNGIELMQKNGYTLVYCKAIDKTHNPLEEQQLKSDIFPHLVVRFKEINNKEVDEKEQSN